MSGYAVVAKADATASQDEPTGWPAGWTFPGPPWPPGFSDGTPWFESPSPEDDALAVDLDADLSWAFSATADVFEVMVNGVVAGTTTTESYEPGTYDVGDYTWRIFATVGSEVYVSPEWSFQTALSLTGDASATASATATAYDAAVFCSGSASASASVASASVVHYEAPAAPTDLVASWGAKFIANPNYKVNLTWTDNADNESAFEQMESNDGITWSAYPYVYAMDTEAAEAGLGAGYNGTVNWYFRVRAYRSIDGITTYSAWNVSAQLVACGGW